MTTTEHDDAVLAALVMKVLAGMARERGLERVAELGDLPPLDPSTAARYLTPRRDGDLPRASERGRTGRRTR